MIKELILVLKIGIYYLFGIILISYILYLRAYLILGRFPENESEEARSFGLERFIEVFIFFFSASLLITPLLIVLLMILLFYYRYRPSILFSILILVVLCLSVGLFFLGIPHIGVWLIG